MYQEEALRRRRAAIIARYLAATARRNQDWEREAERRSPREKNRLAAYSLAVRSGIWSDEAREAEASGEFEIDDIHSPGELVVRSWDSDTD